MAQNITMGFNIALIVFIVLGALWGLIRGLKRTTSRVLFMLVVTIILIFITVPITTLILKIPAEFTVVNAEGIETTSKMPLIDIIAYLLKDVLGESFVDKYPDFTNVLISLPIVFVNAIVYLLLFWIFKYLLYPIDFLIYKLTFGRKKKKEAMGFANFGDDEGHNIQPLNVEENPFEDKDKKHKKDKHEISPQTNQSVESLHEIYDNSQQQNNEINIVKANNDLFVKNEMEYLTPSAQAEHKPAIVINPQTTGDNKEDNKKLKLRKEKKTDKYKYKEDDNGKPKKPKKYRLWGALVGVFVGLLVLFNTMIPIYGFMDILSEAKSLKLSHITEEETTISSITNGLSDDIVKGYELSVLGRLSSALGIDKVALAGFDQVTTQKVKGSTINLRHDVSSIIKTANSADNLIGLYKECSNKGLENITQEELDEIILSANTVLDNTQEIEFVNALSQYALPIIVDMLDSNDIQFTDNQLLNDLIIATLRDIEEDTGIVFFDEVNAIVDIATYLNEQKLLIVLISSNTGNALPALKAVDEDFSQTLSSKLFAIKSINKTLPDVLNLGIQIFDDMVHFGYNEDEDKNTNTQEEIKNSFVSLIENIISTAQSMDNNSPLLLSYDSFVPLGKTLNTLRNSKLFNLSTYNKLIDYTCKQLKGVLTASLPENLQASVSDKMLNNVIEVHDWEEEMTIWRDAVNILRDSESGFLGNITEGEELRQGYSTNIQLNEVTLSTIGKFLDKLETTTLLKTKTNIRINATDEVSYEGSTLVHLFSSVLNELDTQARDSIEDDSSFGSVLDIISTMRINLIKAKHLSTPNSTFWHTEMEAISPLFINIYNMLGGEDFALSNDLGKSLDKGAKNSVMLGGDATWKLMSNAIDLVKDSAIDSMSAGDLKNSISQVFTDISSKLKDSTYINNCQAQLNAAAEAGTNKGKYWEIELDYLMSLKNIADKSSSITTIAGAKEIASDLDTVYQTSLIETSSLNNAIAVVLEQMKNEGTTGIDGSINNTISSIATDLKNNTITIGENFWQTELNYIDDIMSIDFGSIKIKDASASDTTLADIGNKFDTITGKTSTTASQFITSSRIRNILSSAINPTESDSIGNSIITSFNDSDIKSILSTALNKISENITNNEIESFATELEHLQNLANIEVTNSIITDSSSENMSDLLALGSLLDSIAYNIKEDSNYVVYNDDANSKWITRSIINQLIIDMFDMSKDETVDSENQQAVAYDKLITSITGAIDEKGTKYTYQWQTELKFVGHLLDLKNTTLETSNIGKPLDAIAFNINADKDEYLDIVYTGVDTNGDSEIDYFKATEYPLANNISNSIFVTREILRDNVTGIFANFKEEGVAENEISINAIKNDLLDNLSGNVNISASPVSDNYNTFTTAFSELETIKNDISDFFNIVDGKTLSDIDAIAETLDTTLNNNQSKLLYGIVTTRKLALLITNEIISMFDILGDDKANYSSLTYLTNLQEHYTNNLTSKTPEVYSSEESNESLFYNPFKTYNNKYKEDLANLGL